MERGLLHGLAKTESGERDVPDGTRNELLTTNKLYWFWRKASGAAGIVASAHFHKLRLAQCSHTDMNCERLHVAGRLLGHRRANITNHFVFLHDATLSQVAESVAASNLAKLLATKNRAMPMGEV